MNYRAYVRYRVYNIDTYHWDGDPSAARINACVPPHSVAKRTGKPRRSHLPCGRESAGIDRKWPEYRKCSSLAGRTTIQPPPIAPRDSGVRPPVTERRPMTFPLAIPVIHPQHCSMGVPFAEHSLALIHFRDRQCVRHRRASRMEPNGTKWDECRKILSPTVRRAAFRPLH